MTATPLLDISAARVFFDGIFSDPRVAHPEGVAVHRDGSIWCGTETGDLLRIAADGSSVERMAGTDGFLLGIAFDSVGNVFVCDLRHAASSATTRRAGEWKDSPRRASSFPTIRSSTRRAAFSTSPTAAGTATPGPGIFRFDLGTGEGGVWCSEPMDFANGMAMAPDGSGLYVVQSDVPCVSFVPILPTARPGWSGWSRALSRMCRTGSHSRPTARSTSPATNRAASTV